jgi:RimJ/RimL family protein N-acetyltransferase
MGAARVPAVPAYNAPAPLSGGLHGFRVAEERFEFMAVELPADGDLHLVRSECQPAATNPWGVPAYQFRMQSAAGEYIGRIRLRVGWNDDIVRYAGQVGYAVEPAFRGRRYAERACRMIIPVAQRHGMLHLWITCQPDNVASRRTLERLGAECVGVVDVPADYPLDAGAVRQKMCFRLELAAVAERARS